MFEPLELIARLLILGFCLPIHEFAHAYVAHRLGDPTPERDGRLTLNPLAHLDPIGSLMIMVAGMGWARPVMVDPYRVNRRTPYGMVLVSLAGPLSNLLIAILVALPFRLGLLDMYASYGQVADLVLQVVSYFIWINLILAVFNMIPLPPLDGDKVLAGLLPGKLALMFDDIRPYGPFILLGLLFVLPRIGIDVIGMLIVPPAEAIYGLLIPFSWW